MKLLLSLLITMTFSSLAFAGFAKSEKPGSYDILFVVDDSGSMNQYQNKLSSSLGQILSNFNGSNFHLGVTTSSALTTQGIVAGTELIGENVTGNFTDILSNTASTIRNLGVSGSATEIFLPTIFAVLTSPANQGFLRDDSKLIVVIVTDEGDYSDSSVSGTIKDLMELKSFDDIKVHGILGTDAASGCFQGQTASMMKVQTLISAFGGMTFDLCSSDWSTYAIPR